MRKDCNGGGLRPLDGKVGKDCALYWTMNNLDAIPVFVKVVEAGSFSAAARLLNMPKTTVSAKIAALEKRMELKLIPRITRAYLAGYPGTSVELLVSNRIVDLIGEGIDLAIRAGTLKDSSLIAKRFFDVGTTLWASPAYLGQLGNVSHPRGLAKASFVVFKGVNKGLNTLRLTNGRSEVEVPMAGRIVDDDLEAIKALAILGEGIAWLPDFLASDAVEAGSLVSVLPNWKSKATGSFSFVYAGRKYTSP